MGDLDYWRECLESSFDEHGVELPREVILEIAKDVAGAHENYGMAFAPVENPLRYEVSRLARELSAERGKVLCKPCNGTGRIVTHGPYHSSNSECSKCRGDGRHAP